MRPMSILLQALSQGGSGRCHWPSRVTALGRPRGQCRLWCSSAEATRAELDRGLGTQEAV